MLRESVTGDRSRRPPSLGSFQTETILSATSDSPYRWDHSCFFAAITPPYLDGFRSRMRLDDEASAQDPSLVQSHHFRGDQRAVDVYLHVPQDFD